MEVADSGFQAGFTVARFKPDLILMDLMMPDMDGFEVHRTLREDPDTRHVPVIACTAYRDPDVDRRIREERFDGSAELVQGSCWPPVRLARPNPIGTLAGRDWHGEWSPRRGICPVLWNRPACQLHLASRATDEALMRHQFAVACKS